MEKDHQHRVQLIVESKLPQQEHDDQQQGTNESVKLSQEEALLQPYEYLLQNPGKDLRSKWIQAFEQWMSLTPEQSNTIREVIAMLHTASLMIDDVEDNSELRRGVPATHKVYGIPSTINSANYVYFLALDKVMNLAPSSKTHSINEHKIAFANTSHSHQLLARIFTDELLLLHRGQGMDIYWRDQHVCPTIEEYYEMVGNRRGESVQDISNVTSLFIETGGLLRLAVKLMQACSGTPTDYVPLVNLIGIHYQIRDDYVNLKSEKYMDTKGFAEDLTEGKFSFPIVHYIHHHPLEKVKIIDILKQRTTDVSIKKETIRILERSGTFHFIKHILVSLETRIRSEIASLGGNPILEKMMDFLGSEYRENKKNENAE